MTSRRLRYLISSFFLLFILPALPLDAAEDDPAMPSLGRSPNTTAIEPRVRSNPDYPGAALGELLAGWVLLHFSIMPNGDTADVIALSSSNPIFESEAIGAVSRWKYDVPEGAGARGASVQSSIRFTVEGAGVRNSAFMNIYRGAEPFVEQGDFEEVVARLGRGYERIRSLEDWAMYHWLVHRVAAAQNEKLIAADAIDMMEPAFGDVPNDVLMSAVEARVKLGIENGELKKAQNYIDWARTFEGLKEETAYAPFIERLAASEQVLATRRASPDPVSVAGRGFRRYWTHQLTHHEFALGAVQGTLESVRVGCANAPTRQLDVLIDSGYRIPDAWNDCLVIVEADRGTLFTLTEYPPEPAAGAAANP